MRFVVFLFGLLVCPITLAVGAFFVLGDMVLGLLLDFLPAELAKSLEDIPTVSMTGVSNPNAGIFIALAGAYGLLGTLMTLFRRGRQGGALMIIPVLAAGALNPWALPFMSLQFFVGLLALLVGPLPIEQPKDKPDDDEDDEEEEKDEDEDEDEDEEEEEVKPKARKKK
jgi:hypothetical protein